MDIKFDTVNQFLDQWRQAHGEEKKQQLLATLEEHLSDPDYVAVLPSVMETVFSYMTKKHCGDEVLRSMAIGLLAVWRNLHVNAMNDFAIAGELSFSDARLLVEDMTKIELAIRLIDEVASMSGDKTYKQVILDEYKEELNSRD